MVPDGLPGLGEALLVAVRHRHVDVVVQPGPVPTISWGVGKGQKLLAEPPIEYTSRAFLNDHLPRGGGVQPTAARNASGSKNAASWPPVSLSTTGKFSLPKGSRRGESGSRNVKKKTAGWLAAGCWAVTPSTGGRVAYAFRKALNTEQQRNNSHNQGNDLNQPPPPPARQGPSDP